VLCLEIMGQQRHRGYSRSSQQDLTSGVVWAIGSVVCIQRIGSRQTGNCLGWPELGQQDRGHH
jgi:hypothetical protein